MRSFGERLRAGREEKGISLEDVSKATKISPSVLQALENDQVDDLPPNVYVRGFIRSYCRYGGLDETELLKSYEEAAAEKKTAEFHARKAGAAKGDRGRLFLLLVLLGALLALFLHDSLFTRPNAVKVIPEPEKDLSARKGETPAAKKEAVIENPMPPAPTMLLRMVISCVSGSWLEITIDHDRPFEVNLFQGDEVCWKGEERIALRVGNAGGISITVNEIPLQPFGKPEEVVNLLFEGNAVSLNGGEPQELKRWEMQKKN